MAVASIIAFLLPPVVGAMGAVLLFQIVDRLIERKKRQEAEAGNHRVAA
jgi:hypothetical protein